MMNGGDLYELAKILGHANIKMTERYAKLGQQHIARTGSTARELWRLLEVGNGEPKKGALYCSLIVPRGEFEGFWLLLSALECGVQGRN